MSYNSLHTTHYTLDYIYIAEQIHLSGKYFIFTVLMLIRMKPPDKSGEKFDKCNNLLFVMNISTINMSYIYMIN